MNSLYLDDLKSRNGTFEEPSNFPMLCIETRRWEKANIPFMSPQIGLDIALYATAAKLQNKDVASKTVHLTVGYSSDRVREVLIELERGGWIIRKRDRQDGRIRLIEATDKLIELMLQYENITRSYLLPIKPRFRLAPSIPPEPYR